MNELIKDYIELAIKHGEYIISGDSQKANRIHRKLMNFIPKIQNDKSLHELYFGLINHDNLSVQIWTCVELSNTFREESIMKLKEIEKTNSIFSVTATAAIDMINKHLIEKTNWRNY